MDFTKLSEHIVRASLEAETLENSVAQELLRRSRLYYSQVKMGLEKGLGVEQIFTTSLATPAIDIVAMEIALEQLEFEEDW